MCRPTSHALQVENGLARCRTSTLREVREDLFETAVPGTTRKYGLAIIDVGLSGLRTPSWRGSGPALIQYDIAKSDQK